MNWELPDIQAGFRKGRGTKDQIPSVHWIIEKAREFQKNKAFGWITTNWKILKEMAIPDHLTCLLRNLCEGQEATELDMKQQTGSKSGKEYVKAIYCHPDYLTNMQSTSCEMQGVNIQPCGTPFPILNQSIVSCLVLTVASWPAYRYLSRQVVWYSHLF